MLILIVVIAVSILLSTGVLCVAMLLVGDEELNQDTALKCLGISTAATLVRLIPMIGLISIVVWFVGVMVAFEKTFGEAFLIGLSVFVINLGIGFGLRFLLQSFAG